MATTLAPYLTFNGNAAEAMKFYQSVFGGDLQMQTFGEVNMAKSPDEKDRIVHARLQSGAVAFMASDGMVDHKVDLGENFSMSLNGLTEDTEKLTEIFNKLSADGQVIMPLAKQFWGDTFGQVTDKFGIQWMVNIGAQSMQ